LPQGQLQRIEQLEQLRWMENGWKIRSAKVELDAVSVDVPEDGGDSPVIDHGVPVVKPRITNSDGPGD